MDHMKIGAYIRRMRKEKAMTQNDLAERLNLSFQTISKWENGTSLPDSSILLDLAKSLDTTADLILNGGNIMNASRKLMSVKYVFKGFEALENVGKYFGEDSTFFTGMVEGINKKMNIDLLPYLADPKTRDVMITEVLVQHIMKGGTVDLEEAKALIKNEKMIKVLGEYLDKYN